MSKWRRRWRWIGLLTQTTYSRRQNCLYPHLLWLIELGIIASRANSLTIYNNASYLYIVWYDYYPKDHHPYRQRMWPDSIVMIILSFSPTFVSSSARRPAQLPLVKVPVLPCSRTYFNLHRIFHWTLQSLSPKTTFDKQWSQKLTRLQFNYISILFFFLFTN